MIQAIEIERLRGIREGKLDGLTPLVVLVGPNGCGKSSVLEALWIGVSLLPGDTIGQVVAKHGPDVEAPWLLWRRGEEGATTITVGPQSGEVRVNELGWYPQGEGRLECRAYGRLISSTRFSPDGTYRAMGKGILSEDLAITKEVRFIDTSNRSEKLSVLYSDAVKMGRRQETLALLSDLVPGLLHLEILTNARNEPSVHLVFPDGSVPIELAGDGIHSLLRLALELATRNQGLVLLEEPELHQHPGALRQTAKAVLAAMRRGIQIVLSTHSLDLIDRLLSEATDEDIPQLSVHRLRLDKGELRVSRLSGEAVAISRGQIEEDLR